MKNLKRKFAAVITSATVLAGTQGGFKSSAFFAPGDLFKSTLGSVIVSTAPRLVERVFNYVVFTLERFDNYLDFRKYKGFRTPEDTMN